MILYEVRDWEKNYTVAQNRRVEHGKPLQWVAMRTKHDGKGFRRVMRRKDAMQLMGAWMLIVEVAAKCPKHGVLHDGDNPLTAVDLADKTLGDAKVFEVALQVFSSQEIAWLSRTAVGQQCESDPTAVDRAPSTVEIRNGTVRNGTVRTFATSSLECEQTEGEGLPSVANPPEESAFDRFWQAYPKRDGRKVGKAACKPLFAKLSELDREHCILAAAHYGRSTTAKEGFAKDPERFLKRDFWRDWLEPQVLETPSRVLTREEFASWNPTTGCGQ